jgi:NAD dependent epimerase/dehydratase family enzyme
MLGEMAEGLLLSGQRAVPERPEQLGFTFRYTRVEDALSSLFT